MGGRVVVIGSLNMDVVARTARHPAVGETVLGTEVNFVPGGKGANQAVAAARLGAVVEMIGRVGADDFGDSLLAFLVAQGVGVSGVRRAAVATATSTATATATGTALIVVDREANNSIVVVPGANAAVELADVAVDLGPGDVVVAQYEIPLPVIWAALALARSAGATTILNPAPALETPGEMLDVADVVVVNEVELGFLASGIRPPVGVDEAIAMARRIRSRPDQVVIATLGRLGAVAVGPVPGKVIRVDGRAVEAVDSTGAGDCFVGALAAGLCRGWALARAIRLANLAASISVQRFGAGPSMPTLADVAEAGAVDEVDDVAGQ